MKTIQLTRGVETLVDDSDYERLTLFRWHAHKTSTGFYARRSTKSKQAGRAILSMHRVLMDAPPGMYVDHIDGNTLNNQRENLRVCSPCESSRNTRAKNHRCPYKGVSFDKINHRWTAAIQVNRKKIWLGRHDDPTTAARAYDRAAREHFGAFAWLNFPEEG